MQDLPYAAPATREAVLHWLERFAGYVRDVDYAAARPLFHADVLAFGTHSDIIAGVESWIATQWDHVWPRTAAFHFDLEATHVLADDDATLAVAIAPWSSTGFAPDGSPFDRPGRATMVFHHDDEALGGWRCVHSHMSLNRGVPQTSHGNRPVKAR